MLKYEGCSLRELRESDLEVVLRWRNSDSIRKNMYTDRVISFEEHRAWFTAAQKDNNRRHLIFLYDKEPLGVVNITGIDPINARCYWGFYVGEPNSPPKAGLAMGYFGIEYIFNVLAMHKLCSEAFVFNAVSLGYHKRLGFIEEGRFNEHFVKNGKYEDIICFALFRRMWDEHKINVRLASFEGGS